MKEITTDEIIRILCGDISTLDEALEDIQTTNDTKGWSNEPNTASVEKQKNKQGLPSDDIGFSIGQNSRTKHRRHNTNSANAH